jgi:hypothetical protein
LGEDEEPRRVEEERMSRDITIRFDNEEAAKYFAMWLCNRGEQEYREWMGYRDEDAFPVKDGLPITVARFHYHGVEDESKARDDASRYGAFMCDWTIRTTLGPITE